MTPFILLGVAVGTLLGLRWSVMALLPGAVVMLISITIAGLLLGMTQWWIGSTSLLSIIGLEIGYVSAAVARDTFPYTCLRRGRASRPANLG